MYACYVVMYNMYRLFKCNIAKSLLHAPLLIHVLYQSEGLIYTSKSFAFILNYIKHGLHLRFFFFFYVLTPSNNSASN